MKSTFLTHKEQLESIEKFGVDLITRDGEKDKTMNFLIQYDSHYDFISVFMKKRARKLNAPMQYTGKFFREEYNIERRISTSLLSYIRSIELHLHSYVTYTISEKMNSFGKYNYIFFNLSIEEKKEIFRTIPNDDDEMNKKTKINEQKTFSNISSRWDFGDLLWILSKLKEELQERIYAHLHEKFLKVNLNLDGPHIEEILKVLKKIRNKIAHNNRFNSLNSNDIELSIYLKRRLHKIEINGFSFNSNKTNVLNVILLISYTLGFNDGRLLNEIFQYIEDEKKGLSDNEKEIMKKITIFGI